MSGRRGIMCGLIVVSGLILALGLCPAHARRLTMSADEIGLIAAPETPAINRMLAEFQIPEALEEGVVDLAILEFRASVASADVASGVTFNCFLVTDDWDAQSVEWEQSWSTPGGDYDRSLHASWTVEPGDTSRVMFDVTDLVDAWATGERANHGLVVVPAFGEAAEFLPACAIQGPASLPRVTVWYTQRRME